MSKSVKRKCVVHVIEQTNLCNTLVLRLDILVLDLSSNSYNFYYYASRWHQETVIMIQSLNDWKYYLNGNK